MATFVRASLKPTIGGNFNKNDKGIFDKLVVAKSIFLPGPK